MRNLITAFVLATMLVSCLPVSGRKNAPQEAAPGVSRGNESATPTPEVERTLEDATSGSKPMVITVRPPMIPIAPAEGTPSVPTVGRGPQSDWQTFTSAALGVAVDYPTDWSVTENDKGAVFSSPQGDTIRLTAEKTISGPAAAGQDCVTLINRYGQTGNACYDAASYNYSAAFKQPADAAVPYLILSMTSQEKPAVFYQMFDTLRPAP
jgi:hypothetical protein